MSQTAVYGLEEINRWQHPLVRDLAWALLSPPLLRSRDRQIRWLDLVWSQRAYRSFETRLQELDADPSPLAASLQARHDHRLGSHFEGLLAFWLADPANSLYRLHAAGIPIRQNQQTLGELDFVVEDLASGRMQHWEVAVKFYLGIRPGGDHSAWIGPGLRDRLDLKVDHLLDHQLPLSHHPAARQALNELGISEWDSICLLKGRLFYPGDATPADWQPQAACPEHWRGWWLSATDFLRDFGNLGLQWCLLPKAHWLTPLTPDVRIGELYTASTLLESVGPNFDNRAIAVVGLRDGAEVERGFITPPSWPTFLPGNP